MLGHAPLTHTQEGTPEQDGAYIPTSPTGSCSRQLHFAVRRNPRRRALSKYANMEYDGPITRSMLSKTNSPSIPMEELPDERQIRRRVYAALPRKVSGYDGVCVCVILCVCSVNWATQNQSI